MANRHIRGNQLTSLTANDQMYLGSTELQCTSSTPVLTCLSLYAIYAIMYRELIKPYRAIKLINHIEPIHIHI